MESVGICAVNVGTDVRPGERYRLTEATAVTATPLPGAEITHRLPEGMLVLVAEVGEQDDRVRISSPSGWLDAAVLEPAPPIPSRKRSFEQFQQNHFATAPGDHHGLDFPFSLEMVREFGPEFLTKAFRAAGTISADNAVTAIVALEPLSVPGASVNAFITLAYAKPESGVEEELFIKFPPVNAEFKYSLSHMAHGEVTMLQFARDMNLPVNVPYLYFGDYSSVTDNYILITERIRFGTDGIEPAYRKGFDHEVPEIEEHYRTLAKAMASVTAAHKTGALGNDLEIVFPFREAARDHNFLEDPTPKIDRLIAFIGTIAPHLFVAQASEPAFLKTFREDILYGFAHKDAVIEYIHAKVDYTGLCHPNLNVDNAWFWRDPTGTLNAGLFDWAGAGQMSIAQALSGMLMMQIPEKHIGILHDVLNVYVDEYYRLSGIKLDPNELMFQYKASLFSTALPIIISWIADLFYERMPAEGYADIKDRFDDRVLNTGLYQCVVWIDCMLREWLEDVTPGDVCRKIVAQRT